MTAGEDELRQAWSGHPSRSSANFESLTLQNDGWRGQRSPKTVSVVCMGVCVVLTSTSSRASSFPRGKTEGSFTRDRTMQDVVTAGHGTHQPKPGKVTCQSYYHLPLIVVLRRTQAYLCSERRVGTAEGRRLFVVLGSCNGKRGYPGNTGVGESDRGEDLCLLGSALA